MPSQNAQEDGALHESLLWAEAELALFIAVFLANIFVSVPRTATVGWFTALLGWSLQCDPA
jgi:hypothetical protein